MVKVSEVIRIGFGGRNLLNDSSTLQNRAFSHNVVHNFGEADLIFMKRLS